MDRKLTYIVPEDCSGLRISQVLRRHGFSRQNLIELKKQGESIFLNNSSAFATQRVKAGDTIHVFVHETEDSPVLPVDLPVEILYEDEDIIVVNKPAGMPTHPSIRNFDNTLANALAYYYLMQDKPFVFRCCNRLDRDTSGVTVIAKHMISASILSIMGTNRELHRDYLAIVRNDLSSSVPAEGTIDVPIGRDDDSILSRKVDYENGERAVTHYRFLEYKNGHSLVSLSLETGRTHQIRVHMKHLGFPLIGDYLYNPDMEYIQRQALHSARMSFRHPITGEEMSFEAPMPEDMRSVLDR